MMPEDAKRLLLLCHSGSWDRLHQAASAAATATGSGWEVDVVFYLDALGKLMEARLDEMSPEPADEGREQRLRARFEELGLPRPSELFEIARSSGRLRLLACSASGALLGFDSEELARRCDLVVGWPTVVQLMGRARSVLYL